MSTDLCTVETFPFDFFAADGTRVDGQANDEGLCIFPTANCGVDDSVASCCRVKPDRTHTGANYMFLAFAFIFVPLISLHCSKSRKPPNEAEDDGDEEEAEAEMEEGERPRYPSWIDKLPFATFFRTIFLFGMMLHVTLQIMIPIFMRTSLQTELTASSRNALIASEAFLVPYREIFQFVEDIVLVRVSYALGRSDRELTDRLVHSGIIGSFCTGLCAALVGSILGGIPRALSMLTNPGLENDLSLYRGCEYIADNVDEVLPLWFFEVWAIPGQQVGKVMSGFMLGAMELDTLGWLGSISIALIPTIWFTSFPTATNRLLILGAAEFAADWALPMLSVLYLISPLGHDLRENTGVSLSFSKLMKNLSPKSLECPPAEGSMDECSSEVIPSDPSDIRDMDNQLASSGQDEARMRTEQPERNDQPESTRTLLIEGLKIMVMDVTIQFCVSLSIYLALLNDRATGYQLTALQSALPTYGIAYAYGMGIMFKVIGPQLIAKGAFSLFAKYARVTLLCTFLLPPLILGSVLPFTREMAFDYGGNACTYANNSYCLPFFTKVFGPNGTGDTFTLAYTFNAFPVGASIDAVVFVLRSMLLALVDLNFMLYSTAAALAVYIPVICVATLALSFGGTAISFFVAMYIPQFILILCFAVRLEILIRRMLHGARGTWNSTRAIATAASTRNLE